MRKLIDLIFLSCGMLCVYFACSAQPAIASEYPFMLRVSEKIDTPLATAIAAVNHILKEDMAPLMLINAEYDGKVEDDIIPVFHIAPQESKSIAEVPRNCRCIVINGLKFDESFKVMSKESILLQGKEIQMLVLLLLHEVGHISSGHYGQFLSRNTNAPVNSEQNLSKQQELEADAFVAHILRKVLHEPPEMKSFEFQKWFNLAQTSSFIGLLSFELSARSMLKCLTCWMLADSHTFWDHSRSHPNFRYRMLKLQDEMSKTETSRELLRRFEERREASDPNSPVILYRAPKSEAQGP